jgi:hypothetical protein
MLEVFYSTFHYTYENSIPPWRSRFAKSIRSAVKPTVAQWPPYAAIHVRTSDGGFADCVNETIHKVFEGVTAMILEWLNSESNRPSTIGLYIATDIDNFRNHEPLMTEVSNLTEIIYHHHQVGLMLLTVTDVRNRTEVLDGLLYTDLFLDMQLAVAAPIGFQGTSQPFQSSLSRFIENARLWEELP